jgi:hypothetical protein
MMSISGSYNSRQKEFGRARAIKKKRKKEKKQKKNRRSKRKSYEIKINLLLK